MSRSLVLERGRQHEAALRLRDPRRINSPGWTGFRADNQQGLRSGCCRAVTEGPESGTPIPGLAAGRCARQGAATSSRLHHVRPSLLGAEAAPITLGRFRAGVACPEAACVLPGVEHVVTWLLSGGGGGQQGHRSAIPAAAPRACSRPGASLRREIFPTGSLRHLSRYAHPHQPQVSLGQLLGRRLCNPSPHGGWWGLRRRRQGRRAVQWAAAGVRGTWAPPRGRPPCSPTSWSPVRGRWPSGGWWSATPRTDAYAGLRAGQWSAAGDGSIIGWRRTAIQVTWDIHGG
ncbi:hypothetical protein K388_05909 [Streptomyces sp. KhCrAH-43]|nr:hypothetical protein K388_05909 [Streptomyces sp. KhCrAH-43]